MILLLPLSALTRAAPPALTERAFDFSSYIAKPAEPLQEFESSPETLSYYEGEG